MQPNSMAHFVCDLMLHTPPRLSNIPDLPIFFAFCKLSLKKKKKSVLVTSYLQD